MDRLRVNGSVALNGTTLVVGPHSGEPLSAGDVHVIIDNDGTDPVVGTFAGLPEASRFTMNGTEFRITYRGGDGNDVALVVMPPTPGKNVVVGGTGGIAQMYSPVTGPVAAQVVGQYITSPITNLSAFPGFTGSIRSATADVDGDLNLDTVLVTGPGFPIRVAVVSGRDNSTSRTSTTTGRPSSSSPPIRAAAHGCRSSRSLMARLP
jgi:hypothetical protein